MSTSYKVSSSVCFTKSEEENKLVIVKLDDSDDVFYLNGRAANVFEMFDKEMTLEEISQEIIKNTNSTEDKVNDFLAQLAKDLLAQELIETN